MACLICACDFKLKPFDEVVSEEEEVRIQRYDRLESLYLTTGDFSALQQMSTDYPIETRTLIENVLGLGTVDDPEINSRFLRFFQDSTLQVMISDAEAQYANMDDLNSELTSAFHKLRIWVPTLKVPMVYAQISALDQSIVVGDASVGICLDKYLGENYSVYRKYYDDQQRQTMDRQHIVPDVLLFYLLSQYSLPNFSTCEQQVRDLHLAKIQWVVNKAIGNDFFKSGSINVINRYLAKNPGLSVGEVLSDLDYGKYIH